jgi:hypothetical protein
MRNNIVIWQELVVYKIFSKLFLLSSIYMEHWNNECVWVIVRPAAVANVIYHDAFMTWTCILIFCSSSIKICNTVNGRNFKFCIINTLIMPKIMELHLCVYEMSVLNYWIQCLLTFHSEIYCGIPNEVRHYFIDIGCSSLLLMFRCLFLDTLNISVLMVHICRYYQIRLSLKTSQKATAKVDVKISKNDGTWWLCRILITRETVYIMGTNYLLNSALSMCCGYNG